MNGSYLKPPRRAGFLDEWRGLAILLMILYHASYDIVFVFHLNAPMFEWRITPYIQLFICGSFIFVSGACCRYSRSSLKRGVLLLCIAMLMTAVTYYFMYGQRILFGILHFLGAAMILFALFNRLLDRLPVFGGAVLMAALTILTWNVPQGTIGIPGLFALPLPAFLYRTAFLFPLGFPGPGFYSADYFPLLPWIFWFFTGSYVGVLFASGDMPRCLYRTHIKPLAALGRYSLPVYVLHQPVLYGVILLILTVKEKLVA